MGRRVIEADLIGHDRQSPAFRSAGRSAEAYGGKMKVLSGAMKVGLVAAAGAAATGIGVLGYAMVAGVKEAADYQQLNKQTAAVLTTTGNVAHTSVKHIDDLASSLESLSGVDEMLIINSQNVLATFTNIRNTKAAPTFDLATKAALNLSVAMHEDLQSATVQVGKALQDPVKGATALRRVGVALDDQQKKLIATYVKHGQTAKAQGVILAELSKEFGNASKAAGQGYAGSLARAKDAARDAMRTLGFALLPTLTKLFNWIATKGVPGLVEFSHWIGPRLSVAWGRLVAGARLAWSFFTAQLWPAIQQGVKTVMPAINLALHNLQGAWKNLSTTGLHFHDILAAMWPVLKVIGAVIGGVVIGAFVAWSYEMKGLTALIKNGLVPAARFLFNVWVQVIDGILGVTATFAGVLGHLPGKAGAIFRGVASAATTAKRAIDGVKNAVNGIPSHKTVTITVQEKHRTDASTMSGNFVRGLAGGGVIPEHVWGIGASGQRYEFGEHGPEVVVPMNRRGAKAGGGAGDTFYININETLGSPEQIARRVQDVILTAKARGTKVRFG